MSSKFGTSYLTVWSEEKHLTKKCIHLSRIRQYSTECSKKLRSYTTFYNHKQNALLINYIKWKNSSIFDDELFHFHSFHRFQTQVLNINFGLFKFELKSEIAKFQYSSYLTHLDMTIFNKTLLGLVTLVIVVAMSYCLHFSTDIFKDNYYF